MLKPLRSEIQTAAEVFQEARFRTIGFTNAARSSALWLE